MNPKEEKDKNKDQTKDEKALKETKADDKAKQDEKSDGDEDGDDKDPKDPDGHKSTKGEKKFKKAMLKSGATQLDTVKRVTLRTNKNFVMYIDNPAVLKTGEKENSYVVFGEPKFLDFKNNPHVPSKPLYDNEKKSKEEAGADAKPSDIKKAEEVDDSKVEEIGPNDKFGEAEINHLMEYSKCSKNKAIRVLREANGDIVDAITRLT